ncbi:MAG: exodeoxyribonuclease VII large subunit [Chlamydiae bacterium]|nr:exodeoxyribonuclease VII large subunit [Chlamydiota bacterium]
MKALSVTELTAQIKKNLETGFSYICVQGEISNIKLQTSGHYYFTLKDAGAQISSVLFKGQTRTLTRPPKEGDQVVVQGELSVYAPRGNYQLIVKSVDYIGVGNLLLKLHELKSRLEARGLFDSKNKKPLPRFPKTIGVVTSPTGAVIQDIIHVLERRFKGFHLILNPVKVQGEGAALEIAKAIEQFNAHNLCDVLIVGRGGGSLEDLWAFNEEIVVNAIAKSRIPVISAVGHETDISLSDFAADVRAPTPSAAAEICMAEKAQQLTFLAKAGAGLTQMLRVKLQNAQRQLASAKKHPYLGSPYHLLSKRLQDIDEMKEVMDTGINNFLMQKKLYLEAKHKQTSALKPTNQIKTYKEKFTQLDKGIYTALLLQLQKKGALVEKKSLQNRLDSQILLGLKAKKENYGRLISHLKAVNPKNLLTKGYCILFSEKNDSVILNAKDVALEQRLRILLQDGQLQVKVEIKL